jgi:hypothetical protein
MWKERKIKIIGKISDAKAIFLQMIHTLWQSQEQCVYCVGLAANKMAYGVLTSISVHNFH